VVGSLLLGSLSAETSDEAARAIKADSGQQPAAWLRQAGSAVVAEFVAAAGQPRRYSTGGCGGPDAKDGTSEIENPAEFESSPEARELSRRSAAAWGEAHLAASGDPQQVAAAVEATTRFYVPDPA
jgi:hypothetical protein